VYPGIGGYSVFFLGGKNVHMFNGVFKVIFESSFYGSGVFVDFSRQFPDTYSFSPLPLTIQYWPVPYQWENMPAHLHNLTTLVKIMGVILRKKIFIFSQHFEKMRIFVVKMGKYFPMNFTSERLLYIGFSVLRQFYN